MSALVDVSRFTVEMTIVDRTLRCLRNAGRRGYEAFVLWGGRPDPKDSSHFLLTDSYFPEQTTMSTSDGLLVVIEGEALFRVNRAFHERGLTLAAQIHSHPTDAYHSETDDAYPMVTLLGGLSGVVPNFGKSGREGLQDWVWYRLTTPGEWSELDGNTEIEFVS